MRYYDRFTSIFWLVVGMIFLIGGINLGIGQIMSPGAGFIPALFGGILSLLAGVLFFACLGKKGETINKGTFWKEAKSWRMVLSSLSSVILYALLLNPLGYIITTFVFLTYLIKFIGEKGWWQTFLIGIAGTSFTYIAFKILFEVPLPRGIWGF